MSSNFRKIGAVLAVFAVVLAQSVSYAEVIDSQEFLDRLKQELNLSKSDYRQILDTINANKQNLKNLDEETMTLQEQLDNLDQQADFTTSKLIDVVKQIVKMENEVALLNEQIETKEVALEYQKELLKDYLRVMYEEQNTYFNVDANGNVDTMKLLFADESVSEVLKNMNYIEMLDIAGREMLDTLDALTNELEDSKKQDKEKRLELNDLRNELAVKKQELDLAVASKQNLLNITAGQESIYEQLLEQSVAEQEDVLNDMKELASAVEFIEQKIKEDPNFDPKEYSNLLDKRVTALYEFRAKFGDSEMNGLSWPIDPERGISAFFRDQGYRAIFGFEHNAIDIPIAQGSAVRAPADGVVYKTRDNGYGYNYIIVAHAKGYQTTYGHVSDILVEEGESVKE
ncbi:MAG: peptidoglycan DD-metalloendopeptidase family protein, partial [Candidatus Gracilibacteria bacterium]